jgi:four helix bundle protein
MDKEELRRRTKQFALRVLKLIRALPREIGAKAVAGQLVRSGMSVGANYRSSLRARSRAEWLSKLNTCLEESDESEYWMELMIEDGMLPAKRVEPLLQEAGELTAIFAAAIKSGRDKN